MGVKHLQKLDIRSDDGNQIPLVPALQLWRGTEPAQGSEHLIADECQQLEGDEMVAGLFAVAQNAAQQGESRRAGEQAAQRQGSAQPQNAPVWPSRPEW